jgi:hypothetical protein
MSEEKFDFMRFWQFLALVFLIGMVIGLTACVRIYDDSGKEMIVREAKLDGPAGLDLFAQVKGSIYGAGEFVSVFGNCLDVNDAGVVGSYGKLSAWYPNGTQLFTNASMSEIQTGYFVYTGYMDPVQGTYLTEFTCRVNGTSQVAVAFGEWQNPYWVTRIANVEDLSNQSIVLMNQALAMLSSVNQTLYAQNAALFASLNQSMYLLSQQLSAVAVNLSTQIGDSFQIVLQNNAILNQLCYGNTTGVEIFFEGNVTTLYQCPVLQGLGENSTQEAYEAAQLQLAIDLLNALCFANTTGVTVSFNVTPQMYECTTLQNIQSSLDALQIQVSALNASVSAGFNQTYLLINGMNQSMTEGFNYTQWMISELNYTVVQGFNQTFYMFNVTNSLINESFYYLNQTLSMFMAPNLTLRIVDVGSPSPPVHYKQWTVTAYVYDYQNDALGYPLVSCYVDTNNIVPTVNASMNFVGNDGNPRFTYSERVGLLPAQNFTWTVNCAYN